MSILLDALRKSEQKQRLGDVPDIHQAGPEPVAERPGPSWRGLLMLAVPVFLILAWLAWQQLGPGPGDVDDGGVAEAPVQPVTDEPVSNNTPSASEVAAPTQQPTARVASPVESLPSGPAVTRNSEADATTTSTTALSTTSPSSGSRSASSDRDAEPGPGVNIQPLDAVSKDANGRSTPVTPGTSNASSTPASSPTTNTGSDTDAAQWRPERPGPMSYWQLPDDVRAAVGELKVSVLVYDDQPERRFILLNGERAAEGDSPRSGLEVVEIQRDGVVFSYQLYRFVLKR